MEKKVAKNGWGYFSTKRSVHFTGQSSKSVPVPDIRLVLTPPKKDGQILRATVKY